MLFTLGCWRTCWDAWRGASRGGRPAMSTSPGRGGLLATIRSRFTALHPRQPCNCGRSAETHREASRLCSSPIAPAPERGRSDVTRQVQILAFDDMEVLDYAGPYEVFNVTGELGDGAFAVASVGVTASPTGRG